MIPVGIMPGSPRNVDPPPRRGSQVSPTAKDVMEKCFRPEIVRPRPRGEVVHISGIRSHPPALGGSVVPPWPRQGAWQSRLRQALGAGGAAKP